MEFLHLDKNQIEYINGLQGLTNLKILGLSNNQIIEITALVNNSGIGSGDTIYLSGNQLSDQAINYDISALQARGGNCKLLKIFLNSNIFLIKFIKTKKIG